jgi:hypothetical protein
LEDDVVGMTSEETAIVKNIPSNRSVMYVIPLAITFSLIILLLGYFLGESLIEAGIFALIPMLGIIPIFLASRKIPIGIGVSAKGIQLISRKQGKVMMLWKDVISQQPIKLDRGMYKLRGFISDGRPAVVGLSEEPAQKVREMWSRLFPDGRDISEYIHSKFPTG